LNFAIGRRNVDLVRYFLDQGADVHKVNDSGSPPLHLAAGGEGSVDLYAIRASTISPNHLAIRIKIIYCYLVGAER
jgi:ankyrin repeat protein